MKLRLLITVMYLTIHHNVDGQQIDLLQYKPSVRNYSEAINQNINSYSLLELSQTIPIENFTSEDTIVFTLGAKKLDVILSPNSALSSQMRVSTSSGKEVHLKPIIPYTGFVLETGEDVRLTISENFIYGYFELHSQTYFIEPANFLDPSLPENVFILYDAEDVKPIHKNFCAVDEKKGTYVEVINRITGNIAFGSCYYIEIAIACDALMFQSYSSIQNIVNRNIGIMNNVQGNFDDEFANELIFGIVDQYIVDNGVDPWSSSTDPYKVLNDFRLWAPIGFSGRHDLGILWTDRNLNGDIIGLAHTGFMCPSVQTNDHLHYNLLQDYTSNAELLRVLSAHELGHNFGANHDPNGSPHIMAPKAQITKTWSDTSVFYINSHLVDHNHCFSECSTPNAEIEALHTEACPNSPVYFDAHSSDLIESYHWKFTGGRPSTSNLRNPIVSYSDSGKYDVELTVSNAYGSSTTFVSNMISVGYSTGTNVIYHEGFDKGFERWTIDDPNGSPYWRPYAWVSGNSLSDKCAYFFNARTTGEQLSDYLISDPILIPEISNLFFDFEYAIGTNRNKVADLLVYISTDGGNTYDLIFNSKVDRVNNWITKTSGDLNFFPQTPSEWCIASTRVSSCISIDLSRYINAESIILKFQNRSSSSDNLFIDNIQFYTSCAPRDINPRINEFNYKKIDVDEKEFIEVFYPANSAMENPQEYSISLYNGTTAQEYKNISLNDPSITHTSDLEGYYYVYEFSSDSLVDTKRSAIGLCGPSGIIQLWSYEGILTPTNGCASGIPSTDVAINENFLIPQNNSIQFFPSSTLEGTSRFIGGVDGEWKSMESTKGRYNSPKALSIKLIDFSASFLQKDIVLKWKTLTEYNNLGFEIQRSNDGEDFKTIGFVGGKGKSKTPTQYNYTDSGAKQIQSTIFYYRLKQVDFDGQEFLSNIISISNVTAESTMKEVLVSPNPTKRGNDIRISAPVKVQLFTLMGTNIEIDPEYTSHSTIIPTGHLQSGIYILKLMNGETIQVILI